MIGIAMISYGIGWNIFLLPNSIATGGVPGVASVIFWGLHVPVQVSYFVINAVLLLFALKILGFKFCIKIKVSAFGIVFFSKIRIIPLMDKFKSFAICAGFAPSHKNSSRSLKFSIANSFVK